MSVHYCFGKRLRHFGVTWLILRSRPLQAFFSMAVLMRRGLVTARGAARTSRQKNAQHSRAPQRRVILQQNLYTPVKSSPMTVTPLLARKWVQASQSSWSKGSSIEACQARARVLTRQQKHSHYSQYSKLQTHNWVLLDEAKVDIGKLLTGDPVLRVRVGVLEVEVVLAVLVELGRGNVEGDVDAALVASLLDGLAEDLEGLVSGLDVGSETTLVTDVGSCASKTILWEKSGYNKNSRPKSAPKNHKCGHAAHLCALKRSS